MGIKDETVMDFPVNVYVVHKNLLGNAIQFLCHIINALVLVSVPSRFPAFPLEYKQMAEASVKIRDLQKDTFRSPCPKYHNTKYHWAQN